MVLICKSLKLTDIYRQIQRLLNSKFTPYIYILFFFVQVSCVLAQGYKLEIRTNPNDPEEFARPLAFQKNIITKDSVAVELNSYLKQIELKGYLNATIDSVVQTDSVYTAFLDPGEKLEFINIYYGHISKLLLSEKDLNSISKEVDSSRIRIPFTEIPAFMNALVSLFENKGNSFVMASLEQIELDKQDARAILRLDQNIVRHVDKVIIRGYDNFPKNYIDHELGLKRGTVFNSEKLEMASRAVNNLLFAEELKPPEVLFTNDSTIIYLYLSKKRSNEFDGIVGFASKEEENGLEFNGYLDLSINNIFNSGETIALFWKNNGQNRQRFYLETELPYIFNLPLSPKVNFELYRQDSTFNNVKANFSLLYSIIGKGQITANINTENSNDLTNGNTAGIGSYSNLFWGLSYTYKILTADALFPVRFDVRFSAMFGSRSNEQESVSQTKFLFHTSYLYPINRKNYIFLQNVSGLLDSDNYFENELFRFGGIYNLRGVNEESIFASSYTVFNLEYRFKPNLSSYFYTITDYSFSKNELISQNTNVLSFGLGYAFQTKAGILNLSYAIGKFENSPLTFDNSKVHIKIVSKF